MNKLALLSFLTAGALTVAPVTASAGSKERAAIGGFLGGLIVGHAINQHHRAGPPPPDVVVTYRDDHPYGAYDHGHRHGYWKEVRVKTWVPGYWTTRYERGRRVSYHVPGYYAWRTDRVWVSAPPPPPPHSYPPRSYSYRH